MRICSFFVTLRESLIITCLVCSVTLLGHAQVRTSTSYQLESDSINFGGGLASSTNYSLESTAGEIATGDSDSSTYSLRAGYQQMQETYLSLSAPADVILSPNLGGLTGGISNGSTSVVVLTDSRAGYALTFTASTSPAMQKGGDTIADYEPVAAPNPDISFITGSGDAHFGFSPFGTDVVVRYQNDSSFCNVSGSSTIESCWDGASTTPITIAQGTDNHPNGATTTIYFRVGIGGTATVPAGEYVATTTLTALPL